MNWWIGDWLRYGNAQFGERYRLAARLTGYDEQTLMNYVYVAAHVEPSRRRLGVSWSHHAEIAKLPATEQPAWLDRVVDNRHSVKDLRVELRAEATARGAPASEHPADCDGRPVCPACRRPLPAGTPALSSRSAQAQAA